MLATYDPTPLLTAVVALANVVISAWVVVKVKRLDLAARAADARAARAERAAAKAQHDIDWISKGGPQW